MVGTLNQPPASASGPAHDSARTGEVPLDQKIASEYTANGLNLYQQLQPETFDIFCDDKGTFIFQFGEKSWDKDTDLVVNEIIECIEELSDNGGFKNVVYDLRNVGLSKFTQVGFSRITEISITCKRIGVSQHLILSQEDGRLRGYGVLASIVHDEKIEIYDDVVKALSSIQYQFEG